MAMTAAMLAGWRPAAAEDFSGNDLRDLRIGLAVTALPASTVPSMIQTMMAIFNMARLHSASMLKRSGG